MFICICPSVCLFFPTCLPSFRPSLPTYLPAVSLWVCSGSACIFVFLPAFKRIFFRPYLFSGYFRSASKNVYYSLNTPLIPSTNHLFLQQAFTFLSSFSFRPSLLLLLCHIFTRLVVVIFFSPFLSCVALYCEALFIQMLFVMLAVFMLSFLLSFLLHLKGSSESLCMENEKPSKVFVVRLLRCVN